jgi:hypothetical protein
MSVEIQSDLTTSRFWQDVRAHLWQELRRRELLVVWRVVILPHTQQAKEGRPHYSIEKGRHVATISVPDAKSFHVGEGKMSAAELAEKFASDLEIKCK